MKRRPFITLASAALLAPALAATLAATFAPTLAHASGFDVQTATRAYLDTLQGPARAKSDAYFEGGYWLILWGALVAVLADWLLLRFRLSARFRDRAARVFRRPFGVAWLTGLFYTLWGAVITLPWAIYTGFARELQYDLMNQSFAEWLADYGKNAGVSLLIMPLFIAAIFAVIRRFPRGWWVLGSGLFAAFIAVGMLIGPVYLAPMFNTYTELPDGPVRDRIVALAEANDIPAHHIYLFDASRQSNRISANVSGLGPTIRISLNDNLLKRTTMPEIMDVMGHEMGHYKLAHVRQMLGGLVLITLVLLFAASRIVPWAIARHGEKWGVRDAADPAAMPVYGIALSFMVLLATPVINNIIRHNEIAADKFGLDVAREPDGFAMVAMKLSEYRKIEPGPIEEFLFFDHPSGAARVRMAMQWKKDHVADPQMVTPPPMPQSGMPQSGPGKE